MMGRVCDVPYGSVPIGAIPGSVNMKTCGRPLYHTGGHLPRTDEQWGGGMIDVTRCFTASIYSYGRTWRYSTTDAQHFFPHTDMRIAHQHGFPVLLVFSSGTVESDV